MGTLTRNTNFVTTVPTIAEKSVETYSIFQLFKTNRNLSKPLSNMNEYEQRNILTIALATVKMK